MKINKTNIEIAKSLIKIAKKNIKIGKNVKIKFVKDRPGHDLRYALNSSKIIKKLGWRPKTTFKKGIYKTFFWYVKNQKYYKNISKSNITKRIGIKS